MIKKIRIFAVLMLLSLAVTLLSSCAFRDIGAEVTVAISGVEYNAAADTTAVVLDVTLTNTGNLRKINGYSFKVSFYSAEGYKLSDNTFTVSDVAIAYCEQDVINGLEYTATGNVCYVDSVLTAVDIESIPSFLRLDTYGMSEDVSPTNKMWADILYALAAFLCAVSVALVILGFCLKLQDILGRIATLITVVPFALVTVGSILNGGFKNTVLFWGVLVITVMINGFIWLHGAFESLYGTTLDECIEPICAIITTAAFAILTLFGFTWAFVALFAAGVVSTLVLRIFFL